MREATTFNCVRFIIVRDGSAILSGDFDQQPINVGDIALLGASVTCAAQPETRVTVTTVYLDADYAIDLGQVPGSGVARVPSFRR